MFPKINPRTIGVTTKFGIDEKEYKRNPDFWALVIILICVVIILLIG